MKYVSIKLISYLLNRKRSNGFTLIELLVVVILIGILSAIALPNLFGQIDKARTAEARQFLGALNRAQQAYYFEKASFADDMVKLGTDLTFSSKIYNYSISGPVSNTEVHHQASPQALYTGDVKTVTSAVYRTGNGFKALLCIGNNPGDTPNITSTITCTNGSIIN